MYSFHRAAPCPRGALLEVLRQFLQFLYAAVGEYRVRLLHAEKLMHHAALRVSMN
jgi:hypothetical protein